ncbi:MAG: hypothetical protein IMW88_02140 [Thermoflavifilum sp.]|uniref:hypothetical protein n=1 Tax=Thermoflavifilum sp. TaxID=1968839 RepID=UPI0018A3A96A|nr:hypothetical protein [Thermoflavifilum sp.]QOR76381.1 MAG: hypothetical protein IMW88_02140 [Thermoflavifilum sp.]
MKSFSYMLLGLGLLLGGCATAYRAGQTPDDVYYSPAQTQEAVATAQSASSTSSTAVNTEDGSHYIVYDDQDNGGLTYTQRLRMFNDPNYFYDPFVFYPSYAFNPYFAYSSWWGPSFAWSLSFGNFYAPFYWNPWYPGYYAWYSPYLWYTPYAWYGLPYGYYYGFAGGKYVINPRPANTYAPRMNYEARSSMMGGAAGATGGAVNTSAPRVFYRQDNNSTSPVTPSNARRIFTTSPQETPATNVSPARTRRVFIQRPDERPASMPSNNRSGLFRIFRANDNNTSAPRFQPAPDRSFEPRTFSSPAPVFRSAPVENAAPVRTFSPRGGH